MSGSSGGDVTTLLRSLREGDPDGPGRLLRLVYDELRRLAQARMAGLTAGQTLQPTALVHEAYLRMTGRENPGWENRRHFFFAASRAMRDILVEQARRKSGPKRGGDVGREELDEFAAAIAPPSDEVLSLHTALDELERHDPHKAKIVQLRYFGGLTMAEIADVLGESEATIFRHWRFARTWLKLQFGEV